MQQIKHVCLPKTARVSASPLLFSLCLDELEKLIEEAGADIDCPILTGISLAILLFADDITLFLYSASGLQKQLDILNNFCVKRGSTVNVNKTKIQVFEHRKSSTPSFFFNGDIIEQVNDFRHLGVLMHSTKRLRPAIEYLARLPKEPCLKCKEVVNR